LFYLNNNFDRKRKICLEEKYLNNKYNTKYRKNFDYIDIEIRKDSSLIIFELISNNDDWGLGIGDWGLGIGDWAQSPIPNPQSPIPKR